MIPTPDWDEDCVLIVHGSEQRGPLHRLVTVATLQEIEDRAECLVVSTALGELDNEQIEGLRRRPDFPDLS